MYPRRIVLAVISFVFLVSAAPLESGYAHLPKKKEALVSKEDLLVIREKGVTPEEVFKNGVQEYSLVATDTGYLPSRLIVRRNIPVRLFLSSASSRTLCFVLDEFSLKKGFAPQQVEEVRFLPTKTGHYNFYCPVQEIRGSLVVRD